MKVMALFILGFSMIANFGHSASSNHVSFCKDCGINNPFEGEILYKGCPCKHCPIGGTETENDQAQAK